MSPEQRREKIRCILRRASDLGYQNNGDDYTMDAEIAMTREIEELHADPGGKGGKAMRTKERSDVIIARLQRTFPCLTPNTVGFTDFRKGSLRPPGIRFGPYVPYRDFGTPGNYRFQMGFLHHPEAAEAFAQLKATDVVGLRSTELIDDGSTTLALIRIEIEDYEEAVAPPAPENVSWLKSPDLPVHLL